MEAEDHLILGVVGQHDAVARREGRHRKDGERQGLKDELEDLVSHNKDSTSHGGR